VLAKESACDIDNRLAIFLCLSSADSHCDLLYRLGIALALTPQVTFKLR
jgi:hypothetical protein